jgi:hypothetical protein
VWRNHIFQYYNPKKTVQKNFIGDPVDPRFECARSGELTTEPSKAIADWVKYWCFKNKHGPIIGWNALSGGVLDDVSARPARAAVEIISQLLSLAGNFETVSTSVGTLRGLDGSGREEFKPDAQATIWARVGDKATEAVCCWTSVSDPLWLLGFSLKY